MAEIDKDDVWSGARCFGGKRFTHFISETSKRQAQKEAKKLRNEGYLVRIISTKTVPGVYPKRNVYSLYVYK